MSKAPRPTPINPSSDFSGMPDFAKAIRGLAHVPKKEVDDAIAKEKSKKKAKRH